MGIFCLVRLTKLIWLRLFEEIINFQYRLLWFFQLVIGYRTIFRFRHNNIFWKRILHRNLAAEIWRIFNFLYVRFESYSRTKFSSAKRLKLRLFDIFFQKGEFKKGDWRMKRFNLLFIDLFEPLNLRKEDSAFRKWKSWILKISIQP